MAPPWGTVPGNHYTPGDPGYLPPDVRGLLATNERFWAALEFVETARISSWVQWYRDAITDYNNAIADERAAWDYYESLPLTHPNKAVAHDAANIASISRESSGDNLRAGTEKGIDFIRRVAKDVTRRSLDTVDDLMDAFSRSGLLPKSSVTDGLRPPVSRDDLQDALRGLVDSFGRPKGPGGRPGFPPLGGDSWLDELTRHSSLGTGGDNPNPFGTLTAVFGSIGGSSPAGPARTDGKNSQQPGAGQPDEDTSRYSKPDGAVIGGGYGLFGETPDEGWPKVTVVIREDDAHPGGPPPTSMPDPTRDPAVGLTGNALIDAAGLRNARFQAGFFAEPLGPSRALRPDGWENPGGSVDTSTFDPNSFDPLAPYVSPAEGYEGRRFYPPRRNTSDPVNRRFVEALYPDGGPMGPYNNETPVVDPRLPPPGEGGDPQAVVGVVVAFSAGVRSPTVNIVAGGAMRAPQRS